MPANGRWDLIQRLKGSFNYSAIFVNNQLHTQFFFLYVYFHDSGEIPTGCNFVTELIIPKFTEGSTCFERLTAHHQEL
jgi:hypothetical protein